MEVRAGRADAPVVFRVRLPGTKDFRFRRHLVGGGHEGLALAVDLHPDSAVDAWASLVGVEGEQVALADAVKDAGDNGIEFEVDVGVEAFHDFVIVKLGRSERDGSRTAVANAFGVQIRPVSEVEDQRIHGFSFRLLLTLLKAWFWNNASPFRRIR